jgi:hypothetical protein
MRKHTVKQSLAAGLTALGLMAAAGCGGGDDDGRRSTTTESTTPESTAPPTTSQEQRIKDAYLAAVATVDRLTTTTVDPDDPELEARFVDPLLSDVRTQLSTLQAEGRIWVAGDLTEHRIEDAVRYTAPDIAVLTDCIVANDVEVDIGATDVSFPAPETEQGEATMVFRGGTWFVQDYDPLRHWQGVAGCAV